MSGLGIRLYTDEDIDVDLAPQLRRRGYPAVSCLETGNANKGLSDQWQLEYATQERRAVLVHNIDDYVALDHSWKAQGREHFGIIAVPKRGATIGELVRRAQLHLDSVSPEFQFNLLRYLAR